MDVQQLNHLAQQVASNLQQTDPNACIKFVVWRRGIVDPETYIATGQIWRRGQRRHQFELSQTQVLALLAQPDPQVNQALEALLTHHTHQLE